MAGETTTIDVQTLRLQWSSHSSMAAIASYWTITKDQLVRLRDVYDLPPRHDRKLRFKPDPTECRDPTPREIEQRCKEVRAKWDDQTERARRVVKGEDRVDIRVIDLEPEQRHFFDQTNQDGMF
jgi:hypothetical protein